MIRNRSNKLKLASLRTRIRLIALAICLCLEKCLAPHIDNSFGSTIHFYNLFILPVAASTEHSDTCSSRCKIIVVSRIKFPPGSDENMIKHILKKCKGLPLALKVKSLHLRGLGLIPGVVGRFDSSNGCKVPHIGWNALQIKQDFVILYDIVNRHVYFVHSYRVIPSEENEEWVSSTYVGLSILWKFLLPNSQTKKPFEGKATKLAKRVIACHDVRTNDNGDLVVPKGDQYDVREQTKENEVIPLHMPPVNSENSTDRRIK
ncbi:hypothetical protein L6452_08663 [Arctium lappa]|uniref:Uncharacterized protein n=1 Tax=Arctium lappa TaxID=4217 RepID=A0ACB9DHX5_ARCLA|nr:hypothetical protein L6452_08663 [Arctium lappa]